MTKGKVLRLSYSASSSGEAEINRHRRRRSSRPQSETDKAGICQENPSGPIGP